MSKENPNFTTPTSHSLVTALAARLEGYLTTKQLQEIWPDLETLSSFCETDQMLLEAAQDAARRIDAELQTYKRWADEGETLARSCRLSILFHFGMWWADRPWRKRK